MTISIFEETIDYKYLNSAALCIQNWWRKIYYKNKISQSNENIVEVFL